MIFSLFTVSVSLFHTLPYLQYEMLLGSSFSTPFVFAPLVVVGCALVVSIFSAVAVTFYRCAREEVVLQLRQVRALVVARLLLIVNLIVLVSMFNSAAGQYRQHLPPLYAHMIEHSGLDENIAREVHTLQFVHQCCGEGVGRDLKVKLAKNVTAADIWANYFVLDGIYPKDVRILYSLPWSCCNISSINCAHVGVENLFDSFVGTETLHNPNDPEKPQQIPPAAERSHLLKKILGRETSDTPFAGNPCVERLVSHMENGPIKWITVMMSSLGVIVAFNLILLLLFEWNVKGNVDDRFSIGWFLRPPPKTKCNEEKQANEKEKESLRSSKSAVDQTNNNDGHADDGGIMAVSEGNKATPNGESGEGSTDLLKRNAIAAISADHLVVGGVEGADGEEGGDTDDDDDATDSKDGKPKPKRKGKKPKKSKKKASKPKKKKAKKSKKKKK